MNHFGCSSFNSQLSRKTFQFIYSFYCFCIVLFTSKLDRGYFHQIKQFKTKHINQTQFKKKFIWIRPLFELMHKIYDIKNYISIHTLTTMYNKFNTHIRFVDRWQLVVPFGRSFKSEYEKFLIVMNLIKNTQSDFTINSICLFVISCCSVVVFGS